MNAFDKWVKAERISFDHVDEEMDTRRGFVAGLRYAESMAWQRSKQLANGSAYEAECSMEASRLAADFEKIAKEIESG